MDPGDPRILKTRLEIAVTDVVLDHYPGTEYDTERLISRPMFEVRLIRPAPVDRILFSYREMRELERDGLVRLVRGRFARLKNAEPQEIGP